MEYSQPSIKNYIPTQEEMKIIYSNAIPYYSEDNIYELSNRQINDLFKKHWKGSQGQFVRLYNLNQSNFSRLLNNKTNYGYGEMAIRHFLSHIQNVDFNIPIQPNNINYVLSKINNYVPKILIFIDCDNCFGDMKNINSKLILDINAYLIAIVTKGIYSSNLEKIKNENWISVVRTKTNAKNSADILLTFIAARLNMTLPINTVFIITSYDQFIIELHDIFISLNNRVCIKCLPNELDNILSSLQTN